MKQETAVEWLVEELNNIKVWTKNDIILQKADILIEQAKEIEKLQINSKIDAIYEQVLQQYNNENITGFSKIAYARCLDIIEHFKKK